MDTIQTERLILKTNCTIVDSDYYSEERSSVINLLELKPIKSEDSGFAIYLKTGELIGHVAFVTKRGRFELSVGIEEDYRKKGYMTEAQIAIVHWIFKNSSVEKIWALLGGITDEASRKILERTGFKYVPEGNMEWWVKER